MMQEMNGMKCTDKHVRILSKVIAVLVAVTMVFMLSGCEQKTDDSTIGVKALQEKIENKTGAYMTDLMDSQAGFSTNEDIAKYIINWAETKGIRVKTDGDIIVMNVDGSEAYKDAPKTVIVCPFDEQNSNATLNSLTLTFYVLKNNEDTGRLTALFVPEKAHDLSSADKLKKKYFGKKTNVICLNGDEHASVARTTGGASRYVFSKDYKLSKPKNKLAFRISITGIKECQIDNYIDSKVNPIVELNVLLAGLRSSSIDFEIGSVTGGTDGLLYPGNCVLTVTVDEDRQAAVEKKIQSRIESFDKRKMESDPEAVFEYEETVLPRKVISQQDSSQLVGFIYTLLEDEYYRDEETDTLTAVCDISYIKTKGGKVRIGSNACSINGYKLNEIDEAEKTLCGLSGLDYQKVYSYPEWDASETAETSEFTAAFRKGYKKYTGKNLKIDSQVTPNYTSAVQELQDSCDMLSVTVSDNTLTDLTGAVMEYLIQSNIKEEK